MNGQRSAGARRAAPEGWLDADRDALLDGRSGIFVVRNRVKGSQLASLSSRSPGSATSDRPLELLPVELTRLTRASLSGEATGRAGLLSVSGASDPVA
jgi:hypothetical protein